MSISLTWSHLKNLYLFICCKRHNSICRCWGLGGRHLLRSTTQSIIDNYVLSRAIYRFATKFPAVQVVPERRLSAEELEINAEYSLERLMLELQYFGHLMQRADSLEKMLILGKTEGRRRRWHSMWWLDGITNSMDMSLSKLQNIARDRRIWSAAVRGVTKIHDWMTEQQQQTSQS